MTSRRESYGFEPSLDAPGFSSGLSIVSTNSPRRNGRLQFRQNSLSQSTYRFFTSEPAVVILYNSEVPQYWGYTDHSYFANSVLARCPVPYKAELSALTREITFNKLRARCGDVSANLAEIWATRKQTADMFSSTITRIAKSYRALKRRRVREALNHLGLDYRPKSHRHLRNKSAPEAWLEIQYGWKPLIQDVFTVINKPWNIVFGVVKAKHQEVRADTVIAEGDSLRSIPRAVVSYTYESKGSGHIKLQFDGSAYDAASRYGITNPALLAWELLPYSFVVDWALPVGDYIEGLTRYSGISFSEFSYTERFQRMFEMSNDYQFLYLKGQAVRRTQVGDHKDVSKSRTFTGFEINPFPGLKNPFSTTHVANALSLLATAFDRRK